MTVRRLVMLRHGQTDYNLGSRMQGQLDTDLSDLGRAQAVAAAEVLGKLQPLLIVSSDLRRAYDTATRLGERTGQQVRVDPRLRETHLGDWQGLTQTQIDAEAPAPGWHGAKMPSGLRTAGKAESTWPRAACRWSPSWSPPSRNGVAPPRRTARWCSSHMAV